MAYETGTALNHKDLLARLRRFITGRPTIGTVTKTGTNGGSVTAILGVPTAPAETWTLTCTVAGATGTFSVSGSVSGAQSAATVGTPYNNGIISFLINSGSPLFSVGHTFSFTTTVGLMKTAGIEWEEKRADTTTLMVRGKGSTGTDSIFVNISVFENVGADIYNWVIQGAAGYNSANAVDNQAGQSPKVGLSLWNAPITYWIIASGRRFIVIAKVSTFYYAGYFGLALPFATPNQYPYPLVIGANLPNGTWRDTPDYITRNYSWANGLNSNYWSPRSSSGTQDVNLDSTTKSQFFLYWVDGSWQYYSNAYTNGTTTGELRLYPTLLSNFIIPLSPDWQRENIDGTYALTPHTILSQTPSSAVMGELEGSFHITGFSNGSENTVTIGADTYLVIQNVYRNAVKDFAAIKLA